MMTGSIIIYVIVCEIIVFHTLKANDHIQPLVWSNFEIADMNFWRSPAYSAFFDYLDSTGGFYYEVCCLQLLI